MIVFFLILELARECGESRNEGGEASQKGENSLSSPSASSSALSRVNRTVTDPDMTMCQVWNPMLSLRQPASSMTPLSRYYQPHFTSMETAKQLTRVSGHAPPKPLREMTHVPCRELTRNGGRSSSQRTVLGVPKPPLGAQGTQAGTPPHRLLNNGCLLAWHPHHSSDSS